MALCVAAGGSIGRFGLGCALCDVGGDPEALDHLRHYAPIAPAVAWNWRWYGYAAEKCGKTEAASKGCHKAVDVNAEYDQGGTDAEERLGHLSSG